MASVSRETKGRAGKGVTLVKGLAGRKHVPALVEAQQQLTGAKIVPGQALRTAALLVDNTYRTLMLSA